MWICETEKGVFWIRFVPRGRGGLHYLLTGIGYWHWVEPNADYADQCRGSCRQRFFNTFVVSAVFKAPRVTAS